MKKRVPVGFKENWRELDKPTRMIILFFILLLSSAFVITPIIGHGPHPLVYVAVMGIYYVLG